MGEAELLELISEFMSVITAISWTSTIAAMIVSGIIANKKGRSVVGWVLLAGLIGWIAVIIVACLASLYVPRAMPNPLFPCIQCQQPIRSTKCPYCGHDHTPNEIPEQYRTAYTPNGYFTSSNQSANDASWYCECGAINKGSAKECASCFRPKPKQ